MPILERKKEPLTEEQKKLVEDNYPLVLYWVSKYNIHPNDYDDVIGECSYALCEAARHYDPKKGEFSTLAICSMKNAIKRYRWKECKWKKSNFLILDDPFRFAKQEDDSSVTRKDYRPYYDNMIEEIVYKDCYKRAIDKIWCRSWANKKDRNIEIINLRLQGYTNVEIGKKYKISKQKVDQLFDVFKEAFKKEYGSYLSISDIEKSIYNSKKISMIDIVN